MYTGATTYTMHPEPELDQQEFYFALTEELRERESDLQNHAEEWILHKKNTEASLELDNIPIFRTTCKRKKKDMEHIQHTAYKEDIECVIHVGQQPISHFSKIETANSFFCNPWSGWNVFEEHNELKNT